MMPWVPNPIMRTRGASPKEFNGRWAHGPIGLRSTGAIARVVMAMTDRRVKAKMNKDGVDTKLDARYVDDGRTLLHPIKAGWSWSKEENKMVWSE